ncbi:hypothetical protein B0H14DRAFT_3490882 [Mycena olivaceomarginata]|nr:hypothetical protein B0H14DRAFT_3490882 [Mycena olivaceomarginata]
MPGVAALKEQAEDARDPDTAPPKAEELKLWLPSELRAEERRVICKRGVAEVEAKLRCRQCVDVLDTFKELRASDLTTGAEEENDGAARKKLAKLGSSKRTQIERSSKKTVFSWIWNVSGGPGEDDAQLHKSVRVEWSKACAQKDRWVEEWQERAVDERADVTPELRAGLRTYAERQVYTHRKIAEAFHTGWSCSMASAVQRVVEQDGWVYRELRLSKASCYSYGWPRSSTSGIIAVNTERANKCAANPPPAGKSSGNSSGAAALGGGGGSGKSKGKGKGGKSNSLPKTNTPANTPANGNTAQASRSKQAKPYAAKLDSTGKLKPEEHEPRMKNNLCMFCGGAGQKMAECRKRPAGAQGKAATVSDPAPPATDASSSESKK